MYDYSLPLKKLMLADRQVLGVWERDGRVILLKRRQDRMEWVFERPNGDVQHTFSLTEHRAMRATLGFSRTSLSHTLLAMEIEPDIWQCWATDIRQPPIIALQDTGGVFGVTSLPSGRAPALLFRTADRTELWLLGVQQRLRIPTPHATLVAAAASPSRGQIAWMTESGVVGCWDVHENREIFRVLVGPVQKSIETQ